jgi:hypothetical protein
MLWPSLRANWRRDAWERTFLPVGEPPIQPVARATLCVRNRKNERNPVPEVIENHEGKHLRNHGLAYFEEERSSRHLNRDETVPFEGERALLDAAQEREHRLVELASDRSRPAVAIAVARTQPLALCFGMDSEHRRAVIYSRFDTRPATSSSVAHWTSPPSI